MVGTTPNQKYLDTHIKEKNLNINNLVTSTIINQFFYI
jgi:hypothetical protein